MLAFRVIFIILFGVSAVQALELEHDLMDPTRPAVVSSKPAATGEYQQASIAFKVSQIYISKKNQMAIVNDQTVKMGDRVDGAEVLAIHSDSVDLLITGSIQKISIMPSIKLYKK